MNIVNDAPNRTLGTTASFLAAVFLSAAVWLAPSSAAGQEICNNCVDDDADDLVDLADPDCSFEPLAVIKQKIKPGKEPGQGKLKLKAEFLPLTDIDPLTDGLRLTLQDEDGVFLCAFLPPGEAWAASKPEKKKFPMY